jgi:hypothetical protein
MARNPVDGPALPRRKRKLPWVADDPKRLVTLPEGLFVLQPVGNTSYCTGLHFYAHPTGDEESAPGLFSYGAAIERDGSITWSRRQGSYKIDHDRADELFEIGLRLARAWFERDPSHCASYYRGLAHKELQDLRRDVLRTMHIRDHLAELLGNPEEPKTRGQRVDGEWIQIPMTHEDRTERRALWDRNLQRAEDKLTRLNAAEARTAQLREIEARCRAFIATQLTQLLPFPEAATQR